MERVNITIPADTTITDPIIRQEIINLKNQLKQVVSALNEVIDKVDKLEGNSNGS